jgi:hypothetical protein
MSIVRALVVVFIALQGVACTTIARPTRPTSPLVREGEALPGVRFDGEEIQIREPGMPVSPSRAWQREVANYTASALNESLGSDDMAPAARTIVSFDLASPSALQLGTWKEMTIGLTSTLPDGTVVKSAPVTGNIDDGVEHALVTGMGIGGTVLDVTAGISSIFFIFSPSFVTGAVFVGALLGGLALNIGQSSAQYVVALNEEVRWSDLYATALRAHVADVRAQIGRGPPGPRPPSPLPLPLPLPLPATPSTTTPDPSDAASPPPLLDPAEPGG